MLKLFVTASAGLFLAGKVDLATANVEQESPVPCELGEWKPKGLCDPATFKQLWTRDVITAPEVGACGSTEEERPCDPTDCQMSPWTPWTDCNAKGYKTRSRSPVQQAQFGGRGCPPGFDKVKCEPRVMGKSDRIAIVGGGVSGLSAAETFVKHGFTNVVVYEAGSSIVPLQHAVKTEDYVYDMDIVYVPALSWQGVGLDARYNTILQEYEQELVLVSEYTNISRENWHLNTSALPQVDGRDVPTLHSYTNTQLNPAEGRKWLYEVQQFFHDYASFFQSDEYNGIQSCLDQEIALKNETFNDWTRRLNYPVLRQSVIHTINLYGNFPVGESPACQVIMILANKMPSMLGPSLGLLATQPDFGTWLGASPVGAVPPIMMNWMMSLSKNGMPSFMRRFKKGYADFFSAVVLKNNINYRTNARVKQIVPLGDPTSGRGKLKIEFTSSKQHPEIVDHVFVAGRPDQVHSILPDDHPMKPLYSTVKAAAEQTTQDFGIYGSAVVSFEVSPNAGFIAQDLFVIDHQKHLVPTYSGVLSATVNLMRMVKMAPAKIMTVVFQTKTPAVDTDEEVDLLVKEMELYGFYNIQVLKMVHYRNTPTRVPVDAVMSGWYDKADAAQGQHGMYFIGETFSGHGVPTTFIHTRDWITRTFNLPVADDTAAEIS